MSEMEKELAELRKRLAEYDERAALREDNTNLRSALTEVGQLHLVTIAANVAAERERCAIICDVLAEMWWHEYKRKGEHRGDPHREGMSDGAEACADAIRKG